MIKRIAVVTNATLKKGKYEFKEDINNPKDKDAVQVIYEGKMVGYIANNARFLQEGISKGSEIKRSLRKGAFLEVVDVKACLPSEGKWDIYHLDIKLSIKKGPKKLDEHKQEYRVIGPQVVHIGRIAVLEQIQKGVFPELELTRTDKGVEVFYQSESVGVVSDKNEDYDVLYEFAKQKISGKLLPSSNSRSIYIEVLFKSNNLSDFDDEKERIVCEGILSVKEVDERISFMLKSNFSSKIINDVLKRITEPVPEQYEDRIRRPKTLFMEYNGYLLKSTAHILMGKYLRFFGGKATGKNTCAETLAWIFAKPLAEVAINEGSDKIDLVGSRILDSDQDGNLKMPFDLSTFCIALREGWVVVLDEINTASSSLLTILHGLDSRRRIEIPGYGVVDVHPQSSVVLTMNEDYVGLLPLNEATADRFSPIGFEDAHDIVNILKEARPKSDNDDILICQRFYDNLRNLYEDGKISSYPISIRGFIDALDVKDYLGLKWGLQCNIVDKGVSKEERMALLEVLNLIIN